MGKTPVIRLFWALSPLNITFVDLCGASVDKISI
jgi:hypothetical protein